MEAVRRMAQLTIRLPNVVFITARTLRSRYKVIKSKGKSASPIEKEAD
jgi:hypothetical protein